MQCEVWNFKCDIWNSAPLSQNARTHGRGWRTAHASSIDDKKSYSITPRQLPPRLARVLLVVVVVNGGISCIAPATRNTSFQILFKRPTPAIAFETAAKPSRFDHFWPCAKPIAPATKSPPNVVCFYLFHF